MAIQKELQKQEKQEVSRPEGVETMAENRPVFVPRTDIYETDEAIHVVSDMPGVDAKSIEVTLENRVLEVRGKVVPQQPDGLSLSYAEYGIGDFQRSFTISEEIDRDRIAARVKDGILDLELPKVQAAKARKIAVKAV